jgi:endonuclease YncB( thermonuclease family)
MKVATFRRPLARALATFALAEIIEFHWITCKGETTDRYKRRIAVCYAGTHDINAEMVRCGWALAYRRYSSDYVDEEADARGRGVGMWAGEFVEPWVWRRR